MIKLKRNVVMFTILTVGAVYFLYEDLRKIFTPMLQESKKVNLALDEQTGYIGRKLLALDSNVKEDSLKLKTELNPFITEKINNDGKMKEISKSSVSYYKLGRNRVKKLNRRKRNARHNDFSWKLRLNITNNENPPKGISNPGSEDDSSSKSGKEKFLNMAVQMEGASPDNSFKELHQAWDSLGLLLRRLYGNNTSLKENVRDVRAEISAESNDIESPDSPTEKPERGRTPKFLFGLLNFANSENPPLEGNGTTPENGVSSESVTSQKTNVVPMEGQTSTKVPLSTNATEAPMEAFGLAERVSEEPTVVPISETFVDFESTSSEFNTQFVEKFDKTSAGPIEISTIKPESSFTSEQLKEFCIGLLSRIQVSPKSIDHFSEEGGSGELEIMGMADKETPTGFQPLSTDVPKEVTTKSTNQRFGIWASIWNRFAGRRLVQHPIDVDLQSSITPKHDIILEKTQDGTNAFSLKSESSIVPSISDSTESDKDFFSDEDGSALTVPDCESFFRQIQNDVVFSKPNLLDIINNPILLNLDPAQFNFTEIHDDKQVRSMRSDSTDSDFESDFLFTEEMMNGLTAPFSNVKSTPKELSDGFAVKELSSEQSDKNSFENTVSNRDPISTLTSFDAQESFQSGAFDKSDTDNLIAENGKDLRKSATETAFLSEKFTTKQIQSFTGVLDDGLFIQSVNARTDESSEMPSSEVSADIDDRIFGILNFGSGERNLEDSDGLTTQNVSEFPENRSFHPDLINFASGDSELNKEFSVNEQGTTSTDSVTGLNIFDLILSLRKEASLMKNTESDNFDINEGNQQTESQSTIPSDEKPSMELQFDPKEKPTENQNVLDLTNMPATQSISDDQTPLQNIFDEKQHIEFHFDPEEKFTESQNVVLDSTNMPVTKSLSEDQTPFQNVLDDKRSGDGENRIFPALLNVFGSGDGRELSEIPIDPELNSEFSECLDCFENKSGSFSTDDYDDCGSDINDTVMLVGEKLSTTINPLSNKIVSDASVHDDAIYLNNKADVFSESNRDSLDISTRHSQKSLISSPVPETINYENYDDSTNIGYEATDYENYDNYENIGYEMINYEYHENSENYTTLQPLEHVHIEGECDESHFDINTEAFSASPAGTIKVPEDRRFMDTLFLTGSGVGGLFGNDDGEINLVQEPDTTSFPFQLPPVSPRQSRRGGRMDDASIATWSVEKKEHESEKQSDFTQPQKTSDNPKLNSQDTSLDEKALQIPEEEKGFGTDSISHLTTLGSFQTVVDRFNNPKINEDVTRISQDVSSKAVTAISIPTNSFIIPKKKAKDLPTRYCNHAGECNIDSNEGCITKEGRGVCDCRRSFVRHPDTDICEAPFMMRTSLKLPAEVFHEDLGDKYSELYKNKTRDAIDTMWLVVYQDPTLEYNIADIDVAGFEEGSLVIHWKLIFTVKNMSISEIVQEVDEKLEENFKSQAVLEFAPLNVENAKLLSFSGINPCEKKELNYCSKDADCMRDEYRGFRCHCKDGYLDNSKNPMYPGEICIAACPPDYCGENGYCEARWNGEKQCLCNGWYFGEKCNVSGILVISCFAGANGVLIVIVLAAVFFCKRRRQRGTRFYENNQIMFQPNREMGPFGRVSPRLAASIALDELGPTKTSKYMAISTPLYMKPDIQITSPSIMGSSISYDYDSTFDRTPSAEVNMEPPKYDSVPEAPKYNSVPEV
ncbi:hypothetical protein AVEN_55540-1 [Araneus ventricosus]|uniref:EGF-like domain-containing protein n=1 Tax=Araneus ventricosus TaxID=182803 RepID=A0A4Y2CAG9_ARAVE|nr:hypothetical protein AVEN_55540-1 [Araneus ventricosus]